MKMLLKLRCVLSRHTCEVLLTSTRRILDYNVCLSYYSTDRLDILNNVPKYYNFTTDVIDKWAAKEKSGERDVTMPAFWWVDDQGHELKWSFQDLSIGSKRTANVLSEQLRLGRGDKLILILSRVPEWWLVNLACIRLGIVLSTGTTLLRSEDIKKRLSSSQAKCIVTDLNTSLMVDEIEKFCPDLKHKVLVSSKEANKRNDWLDFSKLYNNSDDKCKNVQTQSEETMMLFFTSGTTGSPKMAEHTHASYGIGHLITAEYFLRVGERDMLWNMSDTGWAKSAWSNIFAPWLNGACVFIHHASRFDPKVMLEILCKYPISHLCTAPTAYRSVVKLPLSQYTFHSLNYCFGAGEPVNPELIDEWQKGTGLRLYEGYGQTETTYICGSNTPGQEYRAGSMGKPPPGIDLQIVDDEGNILPCDTEGNIGVRYKPIRPVGLFRQYVNDPARTRSVFVGNFYLTGDKGKTDKDGYFYFFGRADDVILSSGYRIGPFEVESALLEHPAVLESAVVSSPDSIRGEVVKAFVILTKKYGNNEQAKLIKELQDHVKQSTAPYKYPRKIEFVTELPKTVSGKIRRVELRNKEWNK